MKHFAALAKSWWNPTGPQRILHKMNNMRMDFINRALLQSKTELKPRSLKALDIGCGGGLLSESLARSPYIKSVTGIDVTAEVLEVAKLHKKIDAKALSNLNYELKSVGDLSPAESSKYDIVTMFEVLEHLDDPKDGIQKAMSMCNPNGWVFLSTINRTAAAYLSTIALGEHILGIVPTGTHTWSKYINRTELESYINSQPDWQVESVYGCIYLPGLGWIQFNDGSEECIEKGLNKLIGVDNGNYIMALRRRC